MQASNAALEDAGLKREQIDGIACGVGLPSYGVDRLLKRGIDSVDCEFLVEQMELDPVWFINDNTFLPALLNAVSAVASGMAKYVLVNRSLHNPVGRYNHFSGSAAGGLSQWTAPYGQVAATSAVAMGYTEYQQRFGARREHMATLALQLRENVQRIPSAYWYGTELTFDDYMESRIISEPMCLFDNDIPVDASGSLILTSGERARDLTDSPVHITGWAQGRGCKPKLSGTFGRLDNMYEAGHELADRLWDNSGWSPANIDVVQVYDGFTPLVWFWLEVLRFCPVGEAWQFIQRGKIANDGDFPLLSGGGNQGWGRLHGFPHVLECYLQLSGRAGERQIPGAKTALSSFANPGYPSGKAILYSADPDA